MATKKNTPLTVETLKHDDATRKNIPTAEYQSVMAKDEQKPVRVEYERRNRDLDPQLVWRGKDEQDWSNLVVHAPPLYIQEKVHPKVLVDDLKRGSELRRQAKAPKPDQVDLFADFNGLPSDGAKTEFYQHDAHWANRMILGDSLAVMASLAEREGLRGKVQCIYLDPPYGIKFNSNFQWSTTNRDVKDGNPGHITREPEQVKAFRDTWRDGIHSYLTYLRDRLAVARDLLTDSGSIFVQIGDENVHKVRSLLDEIFGSERFVSVIAVKKTAGMSSPTAKTNQVAAVLDFVLWYKKGDDLKYRQLFQERPSSADAEGNWSFVELPSLERRAMTASERSDWRTIPESAHVFRRGDMTSMGYAESGAWPFSFRGREYFPGPTRHWTTTLNGMKRLACADRIEPVGNTLTYVRRFKDFPVSPINNLWADTARSGFGERNVYVVQTLTTVVERCLLMATDPGDLVLDPTCGSGTTAFVAEQWGRRWITIDTSRVALALARARIMGARYPFYVLVDSLDGQLKAAELTRTAPRSQPVRHSVRQGFVYERVPHVTPRSIADNAEIDVIFEQWQAKLAPLCERLNAALGKAWTSWEIPRESSKEWPEHARALHAEWWQCRIALQREIDASISAKTEFEHLYDKPYEDKRKVRVAGPFTVESLSPHRVLAVDENDELVDAAAEPTAEYDTERSFVQIILENLKTAGVQQAHKTDKIDFTSLAPWPGELVCAEGRYIEGDSEKRAAVFIGPEFGTVSRPDLVSAAREAGDAGFDVC